MTVDELIPWLQRLPREGSRVVDAYLSGMIDEHRSVYETIGPEGPWHGLRMLVGKSVKPPHDECVLGVWRGERFEAVQPKLPHFTSSIDAAVGLIRKRIPIGGWTAEEYERENYMGAAGVLRLADGSQVLGTAKTAALALLTAALTAIKEDRL